MPAQPAFTVPSCDVRKSAHDIYSQDLKALCSAPFGLVFPLRLQAFIIKRQGTRGRLVCALAISPRCGRKEQDLLTSGAGTLTPVPAASVFAFRGNCAVFGELCCCCGCRLASSCCRCVGGKQPGPFHNAATDISAKTINRAAVPHG